MALQIIFELLELGGIDGVVGYHVKFADPVNLTLGRLNDMDTLDVFNTVFVDAAGVFHFCGWSKRIQHFLEHEMGITGDPMGGWQMSQFHGGQEISKPKAAAGPRQRYAARSSVV